MEECKFLSVWRLKCKLIILISIRTMYMLNISGNYWDSAILLPYLTTDLVDPNGKTSAFEYTTLEPLIQSHFYRLVIFFCNVHSIILCRNLMVSHCVFMNIVAEKSGVISSFQLFKGCIKCIWEGCRKLGWTNQGWTDMDTLLVPSLSTNFIKNSHQNLPV